MAGDGGSASTALTPSLRRTLEGTMPAGFDAVRCVRVKNFLRRPAREAEPFTRDFRANEKFHLSPAYRCDGLDRQINALVYDVYGFTPAEIKIVKEVAS
jgi:hypothetical protein